MKKILAKLASFAIVIASMGLVTISCVFFLLDEPEVPDELRD